MKTIKDFLIALKELILEYLKSRLFPITVLMLVLFLLLVNRLFVLQIRHGETYDKSLTVSSEKTVTVNSIRGNIYDVNGKLLASNKITYNLSFGNDTEMSDRAKELGITENELKNRIISRTLQILHDNGDDIDADFKIKRNVDGSYEFRVSGAQKTTFLRDVYGVNASSDLTDEEANSTPDEVVTYLKDLFSIDSNYDDARAFEILVCRYNLWLNRFQQYVPVEIAHDISEKSRSAIEENRDELYGMSINISSSRYYNDAKYFSHIIGYVGQASQEEIQSLNDSDTGITYTSDDVVGKTGIEKQYESQLHGKDGEQTLYVDSLGKVLDVKSNQEATAGDNIYLSIDSDLQKYCYDTLEKELAAILVSEIKDMNFKSSEDPDHFIPLNDVFSSLFSNHTISLEEMEAPDATEREQAIYSAFQGELESTLTVLDSELTTDSTKLSDLPESYQDYSEYICEVLHTNGIYDTTKVNRSSAEFISYTSGNSSLQDFLKYLISTECINASSIEEEGKFYDSDDIYKIVSSYVIEELKDDDEFKNRVLSNMVSSGEISRSDCIELLYDQGVLVKDGDEDYQKLMSGTIDALTFMKNKITNLDITPAMLNLTPCSGSVIVTDVNTGEIRAMVSYPSYDNNKLTNSIDADYYDQLLADQTNPLFNRSTMMLTPPGSTFKIVSSVAGVNEGVLGTDEVITDMGIFDKVYTKPQCWIFREHKATHGTVGISRALDVSCNYFFYEVGYRLATRTGVYDDSAGLRALRKYGSDFGLTEKSGVELDETSPHFSDNDAVTSAIGQGTHQFAPVQLSKYITSVANSGTTYNLSIIDRTTDYAGNNEQKTQHTVSHQIDASGALWDKIHTGLREVVTDDLSYVTFINSISVSVAGKTGTAQVGEDKPANALFVSYAPSNNPEVSVTTVIPNGYTSGNAAELSGFIYAYLYDKEALANADFQNKTDIEVGD